MESVSDVCSRLWDLDHNRMKKGKDYRIKLTVIAGRKRMKSCTNCNCGIRTMETEAGEDRGSHTLSSLLKTAVWTCSNFPQRWMTKRGGGNYLCRDSERASQTVD
ncbi:uncharacterized protein LOC144872180 [Branchiostoma floridae x Branchiostoma japonicum]